MATLKTSTSTITYTINPEKLGRLILLQIEDRAWINSNEALIRSALFQTISPYVLAHAIEKALEPNVD